MYVNPIPVQPPQEPTAPATTVDYSWYLLPSDYFLDMTDTANGQPTGRLLPSLRAAAQTRDGNQILTQVAGLYADIYSDNNQDFAPTPYLTAMTQLAVTGANAFANCPSFPQTALEEFFSNQPLVQASVATAIINQMSEDYNNAVQTVRSPLAGVNHQDREALGWVAVSGEDDPPDFPVNVRIASYPQYHIGLDVPTSTSFMTLKVRYFVASQGLPPNPLAGPFIPPGDEIILYIHGEGSRAEEALDFVGGLFKAQVGTGRSFTVISLDLPGCGYTTRVKPGSGENATPIFDTVPHAEVAPLPQPSMILGLYEIGNFPTPDLLDFIESTIVNFVEALDQQLGNVKERIVAVMGGSLGGHMALRFAASEYDWVQNVIAWSPAGVWDHDVSIGEPIAVTVVQRQITDPQLLDRITQTLKDGVLDQTLVDAARSDFINTVWYQDTFSPPSPGVAVTLVALAMVMSGEFVSAAATIGGGIFSGWFGAAVTALFVADLVAGWAALPAVPRQPLMWYRDDWPGPLTSDNAAKLTAMQEDLYDRQEIYNENFRQWHWRICMDCIGYSFAALQHAINKNLQLMVGTSDNYPMVHFANNVPQFAASLTGPGVGLSVYDTGHSIHNERPYFLAQQVIAFTGHAEHAAGLLPVWMSGTPLQGPAGDWNRGVDGFVAADVDGDGETEIVIYNNTDLWTGVLKWQNGALGPIWMSPAPLPGPAGDWNRGIDGFVAADVDGDSQTEIVIYNDTDLWTGVLKWQNGALGPIWMSPTPLPGPAGDWNRGIDAFVAADVDGDSQTEVLIYSNTDLWTGVLKWQNGALGPIWMSPTPLNGPAGRWDRGIDSFVAADVDGDGETEIVIYNDTDLWTGVLKWQNGALGPIWMSPTPLPGPAGDWNRGIDGFVAADVDGDSQTEIVIFNNTDLWTGVLKWQNGALGPIWMSANPLAGPAGDWNRGIDAFVAADVDGSGDTAVVIYNNTDLWTGVLKWQNGALVPVWMAPTPLAGPGGDWNRGVDAFVAADVDGGSQTEIVIYNNSDLWTGVLQWDPLLT